MKIVKINKASRSSQGICHPIRPPSNGLTVNGNGRDSTRSAPTILPRTRGRTNQSIAIGILSSRLSLWYKEIITNCKIRIVTTAKDTQIMKFDTIVCLDVLEHLAAPASQIEIFNEIMSFNAVGLFNWYFYKGDNNEYPFHIDDNEIVEKFFKTLQSNFLEIFHPILITTRAIEKLDNYVNSFSIP